MSEIFIFLRVVILFSEIEECLAKTQVGWLPYTENDMTECAGTTKLFLTEEKSESSEIKL